MPTGSVQWEGMRTESADHVGALTDMNARHYSQILGKFISADTIVQNSSDPQTLNRYAFARNNPLRYTDPTGHCFKIPLFGLAIPIFCPFPDSKPSNIQDGGPCDMGQCDQGSLIVDGDPNSFGNDGGAGIIDGDPDSFGNDGGGQIYDGDSGSFGNDGGAGIIDGDPDSDGMSISE